MKRWNIEKIILYSHDGRVRELNLEVEKVNIITGDSHTGKSAVAEVIDYVMGSSECHIPGLVRTSTAWVGLMWVKRPTKVLMCRKIPSANAKSSDDVHFATGSDLSVPSLAELNRTSNNESNIRKFEQLLGMGDVKSDTYDSETQNPVRISLRNTIPYLLQDDDVIISKSNLFRGSNDEHRQSIINSLPYFLGVIDELTLAKEAELKRLQRAKAANDRQLAEARSITGSEQARASSLLLEASQVGLIQNPIDVTVADLNEIINILKNTQSWTDQDQVYLETENFNQLDDREHEILTEISQVSSQIKATIQVRDISSDFKNTADSQRRRLQSIELLPSHDNVTCPICNQQLDTVTEPAEMIYQALDKIRIELQDVERDRPKIDNFVQELEDNRHRLSLELNDIRRTRTNIVNAQEVLRSQLNSDQKRQHVQGRISLYLEAVNVVQENINMEDYNSIVTKIANIESEINQQAKTEALDDVRLRISNTATTIISNLPFDDNYRNNPVYFNPRDLSTGIVSQQRRIEMRDVGSDENYLSLHFAILFALHRYFFEQNRPVPGILLFDQPSRPYFPPDPVNEEDLSASEEISTLKRYFDLMFEEVERGESLQILVLEHAYFSDDQKYRNATKERWHNPNGLIPSEWLQDAIVRQLDLFSD